MKKLIVTLVLALCASLARAETIEYEIYSYTDDGNSVLVANGVRSYDASDIEVIEKEHRGEVHWAKSLELESGFRIGASIYREPKITGFGLWAKNSPCGFSWEWFTASSSDTFDKLQEGGAVSVKYHQSNGLLEIGSISFESDISLRLNETRKEIGGVTHRILIKKGSVLAFGPNNALQRTAALTRPCR
jgi:hypothetical protein